MQGRVKSHAHARQNKRRKDHNRQSTGNTDPNPSERVASKRRAHHGAAWGHDQRLQLTQPLGGPKPT